MPHRNIDQAAPSLLPTKVLYCVRSGLPLASVTSLCGGGWPFVDQINNSLLHPIYSRPLAVTLAKLRDHIIAADEAAWMLHSQHMIELRLHMSAIMYHLDAIWQPTTEAQRSRFKLEASLPCEAIAASGAARLYKLAQWYHFLTSKRLELPLYRISKGNDNLGWENFGAWLDAAWSVHKQWESGRTELERQHQLQLHDEALHMIRSADVLKRIDFHKVWGWIDLQMRIDQRYPAGRRETFRNIFLSAEIHPELWTIDDIEDLQVAVIETCDRENDVYFFINQRLMNLRQCISSFYGSFTLLTSGMEGSPEQQASEREATQAFFGTFDKQIETLDMLPPEPQRMAYPTMAKHIQAMAQWRILKARFEAQQARKGKGG